jgi:toxin ParE1/3/4
MVRVVVSGTAQADIDAIVAYLVENAGPQVADRYLDEFDAIYDRIGEFPDIGPPRPSLGREVRIALLHPYVMIYRRLGDVVTVLRVLHGRRNITGRLVREAER